MIHITIETLNMEQTMVTEYDDDTGITIYDIIDRPTTRDRYLEESNA